MRGRLIRPFLVEIFKLDTAATAADPDGAGALTSGYDPDFREARKLPDASRLGVSARKESAPVRIRAQIETSRFAAAEPLLNGNAATNAITCVLHMQDVETQGLLDPVTKTPLLKVGDRLDAIYDLFGNLVQKFTNLPGLYCVQAEPVSYGIGTQRNLLVLTFESRPQGQASA